MRRFPAGCCLGMTSLLFMDLDAAERQLAKLPGWYLTHDGQRIRRDWTVKNFVAGMKFLNQVMEIAERNPPALFLIDECLHGTNSHDRGIGAEAVVRELLARNAIGLVTTHDLALARVADDLAPAAANVHFQDHLENGEIAFDYRMQPGVVTKSNALALMRAVGLEV